MTTGSRKKRRLRVHFVILSNGIESPTITMPELVLYINKIHMSHGCMMCGQVIMPELIMIAAKDTHYAVCQSCADKRVPQLEALRKTLARYEGHYHTHKALQDLVNEMIETGEVYDYTPIELDAQLYVCLTRAK